MMQTSLLNGLTIIEVRQELYRNIVSLRVSENLFDDLSDDPGEQSVALACEMGVKNSIYPSPQPIIHRPFDDAQFAQAIGYPFEYPSNSRFTTGQWGVWYGSQTIETTISETAYHWVNGLLADTGALDNGRRIERKVYTVSCSAALIDLVSAQNSYSDVLQPNDYSASQLFGKAVHDQGMPGILCPSVRHAGGINAAIFNPVVLSNPKICKFLSYEYRDQAVWCDGQRVLPK